MDCVNHSGVTATAFCQNCGKALCANCVRNGAGGQILCEPCWVAWQNVPNPFIAPPLGGPNPSAAAVLGLIPGVGAMYNGQYFKGLIHVVIFVVIISITTHFGLFGLFIPAWILYQSFEAFHTAKAIRDGQPIPDPLGLNEVSNWLNLGGKPPYPPQAGPAAANPGPVPPGAYPPPPYGAPQPPYGAPYQAPYQPPYQAPPWQGAPFPPAAGPVDPGAPSPVPPPPQAYWRRKEPIGAIVLIGLGLLFLLGQLDEIGGRIFEFSWPLLLIGLGVWLVVRRMGETQGGQK
jgi:LiaI-LiaF-like transmembrane region/B-box zinc finger